MTIWLIKTILANYTLKHSSSGGGIGMPLGNLTSQFFANVYLNELDQFVKHKLKVRYYIRYVDDFVIFHNFRSHLAVLKQEIDNFLKNKLSLNLHPDKSKIISLKNGVDFLGLRIFDYHKILRKKNLRKFKRKLDQYGLEYDSQLISYDKIYNFLEGWQAYAKNADTYNLRKKILTEMEDKFSNEISTKEVNKYSKLQK